MAETGITARFSSAVMQKSSGIPQKQSKQRQLAVTSQPQGSISSRGGTKPTQQYEQNNNFRIGQAKESQGWSSESSQSTNTNTYFDLGSDSSKHNSKIYHKKTATTIHQQLEYPSASPSSEQSRLDLLRMIYMKKLHTRLYEKFSQSQNYYYTRDVSDLLTGSRTSFTIKYKDQIAIDEQEEYLKRIYYLREYPQKIRLLTEYYKFHSDIPRLFMQQLASIMNHMHDKKRKIEFYRIAKLIDEENKKNPTKPPKVIAGDVPAPGTEESMLAKKEKQTGKTLEKGLSCFLEEISSFVNKTGNVPEAILMQSKGGETNMKESSVASMNRFQELQRQQTTAQRLKLERQQLEALKEKQQKQQQRLHKISQNNNNDESSLSVMNSRLRDMLQISRMSQSNMQSETTILDISENHGLDDFLKFLSKQSTSFTGQQENTLTQSTRNILKPAAQLTLLPASQQISLKAAQQQQQSGNNLQGQQNYQQQLLQQQMQQKSTFTRTVVTSLQDKTNKIQQSENIENDNIPAKANQQEQQKLTDSELNQYLRYSPGRVIRHAQQQPQQQQQPHTQPQPLIDSLPQHLQILCQANNLTNQNSENGHNNNNNSYPLQAPKSPKSQEQQLQKQPSMSSSQSTNAANLTKNQNPMDLKLNFGNLNQAVMRSATGSLKNSFGGSTNNNNTQQSSNTNKIAYSIANNADNKNANRNNNEVFQNTSNGKQQQFKRGGTASSTEETILQSSQNNRGLQLQIVQGVANSSQNAMNSYPLTSRVQNNSRNYNNFNTNTPRIELVSKEQDNNAQGLVQQQEQQLLSTGSTSHSRHASTYKAQEQQQYQQPQQQQQQDCIIASQGQQQLQQNNNINTNNQAVSQQQQQQSLSQYQQQFKISKLKKNSINSLHLFSSQQQLISPRTSSGGAGGETDNQIDHILENNNNNNNNQQLSRQQSGNSSSNGGQASRQGITPLSQPKNNPTAMGSSLSTRNSNNVVKALSSVNTPTNASSSNNNKPSQVFTFHGLTSSSSTAAATGPMSSGKNQPGSGSVAMASTMSSFRQLSTQNNNQQNLLNSPQGSQHSIQLQSATASQQQQQNQQPQQQHQQQQFSSYLRTSSTGFSGNLLLQPPQQPAQISNHQQSNPSGSISARNQPSSTSSLHLRQHSNPTTGLTKNSLQSLHRFNYNSNNNSNVNSAKINSENVYSQHNQDYFQSANASPQPPPSLPVSQTLHTNSNIGSPRSMETTKPSFFGSTSRTRPSLQSHQQLQVFIQDPQQQQQQQQQQQGQQSSKQLHPQHSHKYNKSEAQGMLTQSHTFFQAQEYTNAPSSSAFSAFTMNSANSLASLTDRGKLQSKSQQQSATSAAFGQFQQHQQSSAQYTMQSNQTGAKLGAVNQNTSAKQMLAQHASQAITLPQQISSGAQQPSQQLQQPYQLSSNNNNSSHMKNISPRQQLAFPLSKV